MQTPLDVGVDVASKVVVVACAARSFAPRTLSNTTRTLRSWLGGLPAGTRLGVEATGSYHQLLADLAHAAGLTVYVLNPRDRKKYAEGVGRRGKTDRVDAEIIARFVAREHDRLHAYVPLSAAQRQLEQLLKRRGKLVAVRVALELSWTGVAGLKPELAALLKAHARLLGPYYLVQRAKGLSGTAALVVLARKMARTAYGICKQQVEFDPGRIASTA